MNLNGNDIIEVEESVEPYLTSDTNHEEEHMNAYEFSETEKKYDESVSELIVSSPRKYNSNYSTKYHRSSIDGRCIKSRNVHSNKQRRHSDSSSLSDTHTSKKTTTNINSNIHTNNNNSSRSSNSKNMSLFVSNFQQLLRHSSVSILQNNIHPVFRKRPKSFGASISTKLKSKLSSHSIITKNDKSDTNNNNNQISPPMNVQHLVHVEWDEKIRAYKGMPDVWQNMIPQSRTVPTNEFPNYDNTIVQEINSPSMTKSSEQSSGMSIIYPSQNMHHELHDLQLIIEQNVLPPPGPRVFLSPRPNNQRMNLDVMVQPDFHGFLPTHRFTIREYLSRIGFDDLDQPLTVAAIRQEFYIRLGFSKNDPICHLPRIVQRQILCYLDCKSFLRCCCSCSDLASFLDDPFIWRIQVLYTSKVQGTIHSQFALRSRGWKQSFYAMWKVQKNPSYYDQVWNIVVAGDTKSGQDRLVVSLGRHWRCKLAGLEPVISAVNGTYRFGVDFVIRRVVIQGMIIKLQVWDGGNVMTDTSFLQSVNIFLILFDTTDEASFARVGGVARSMISVLENNVHTSHGILVGNTNMNMQLGLDGNVDIIDDAKVKQRIITYENAKKFANDRGLLYIEANTDNGDSVNETFVHLAEEFMHLAQKTTHVQQMHERQRTICLIM